MLTLCMHVVRLISFWRRRLNDFEEDIEFIVMCTMTYKFILQFLGIMLHLVKFRAKDNLRKERMLTKPHILIKLLHGYRLLCIGRINKLCQGHVFNPVCHSLMPYGGGWGGLSQNEIVCVYVSVL